MLILTFIMNLFDFYIVDKYYYCFSKERKRNTFFSITTLVASAFVLSIVNAIGYPIANLICSMFLIYLYCTNFMLPRTYYLFLPMLYLGLCFITEPIGVTIAGFLFGDFPNLSESVKLFYFLYAMAN